MKPIKVFLSHTDRSEYDQKAATAFLVELRRVGLDVWIDREHPAPNATAEQMEAGATPDNPLFTHIVSAIKKCDAMLFVCSETSFSREYIQLEFDPRILFQEFRSQHPEIPVHELPIYTVLIQPIRNPPPFWIYLTDIFCPGRVLNLADPGTTPLILPTVLKSMVRDIAPEHVLSLNPVNEWFAREFIIEKIKKERNYTQGVPTEKWLRLEYALGLGPLFPGNLNSLDDAQLRYAIFRFGDTSKLLASFSQSIGGQPFIEDISDHLALWTANAVLRSKELRLVTGEDFVVKHSLPNILRNADRRKNKELVLSATLQYGYALVTSENESDWATGAEILFHLRRNFNSEGLYSLAALCELLELKNIAAEPSSETIKAITELGCDPYEDDIKVLYNDVINAIFSDTKIESTPEYRLEVRSQNETYLEVASTLKTKHAKRGVME